MACINMAYMNVIMRWQVCELLSRHNAKPNRTPTLKPMQALSGPQADERSNQPRTPRAGESSTDMP